MNQAKKITQTQQNQPQKISGSGVSRRDWLILIAAFACTLVSDQISKRWATGLHQPISWNWIHFELHLNSGVMAGMLSGFPPILKTVVVSTIGAFLVFAYSVIQLLIPIRTLTLRLGLTLYLGGIIGNIIDRVHQAQVVDFIIFDLPLFKSVALNIADLWQWVAIPCIAVALVRDNVRLWPENNMRKNRAINSGFQLRYSLLAAGAVMGGALISGVFSYTFLKSVMLDAMTSGSEVSGRILSVFILLFAAIQSAYIIGVATLARHISHRTAGPIFAFCRHVRRMLSGETDPGSCSFKLRRHDDFKELEDLAGDIARHLSYRKTPSYPPPWAPEPQKDPSDKAA